MYTCLDEKASSRTLEPCQTVPARVVYDGMCSVPIGVPDIMKYSTVVSLHLDVRF
jgi:hypothetical protein